mgnify:CR=1 FL=1
MYGRNSWKQIKCRLQSIQNKYQPIFYMAKHLARKKSHKEHHRVSSEDLECR